MAKTWTCPEGHEVATEYCPIDGRKRPSPAPGSSPLSNGLRHRPRPPGWYLDPDDPSILRYWYGDEWSQSKTRPAGASPAEAQMRPPRRFRWLLVAVGLLAFAAVAAGLFLLFTRDTTSATLSATVTDVSCIPNSDNRWPCHITASDGSRVTLRATVSNGRVITDSNPQ
jgi:hypothetical protein